VIQKLTKQFLNDNFVIDYLIFFNFQFHKKITYSDFALVEFDSFLAFVSDYKNSSKIVNYIVNFWRLTIPCY